MFDEIFRLPTPFGVIPIRIVRRGEPAPTPEQRAAGRRAALELRFAVSNFDRRVIEVAERVHQALVGGGPPLRRLDASFATRRRLQIMAADLEAAFERGQLVVHEGSLLRPARAEEELGGRRPPTEPVAPSVRAPGAIASEDFFSFEARFVDEIGQGVGGFDVEFDLAGGRERATTNPAGVARLDGVKATSAAVRAVDLAAVETALDPRWLKPRSGKAPTGKNQRSVLFDGSDFGPTSLKPEVPSTIVLQPPLGKLLLELMDKTGRVRHVDRPYQISGPMAFSGKTDDQGRLLHEAVFPGDYELKLTLTVEVGEGEETDEYTTKALVLDPGEVAPQVRLLGAVPRAVLARLRGMVFDLNKAFLLPFALPSLKRVREFYIDNNPSKLLIVGHTDTSGEPDFNERLSLERAKSVRAFLEDDVDAWLAFYETDMPEKKRWGSTEDGHMIAALADFDTKPEGEDPVRWFQRTRELEVDGIAGPVTRRQLIGEYMALDGASLEEAGLEIEATTHGCGESFPLDISGEELDKAPSDATRDRTDRRVELFFFDVEFGIQPPPPGEISKQGSTQYPTWRKQAEVVTVLDDLITGPQTCRFRLHDGQSIFLPNVECSITFAGTITNARSDSSGFVEFQLPPVCPESLHVEWQSSDAEPRLFERDILVECNTGSQQLVARARLNNLGYPARDDLALAVAAFQLDYKLPLERVASDGTIPEATVDELEKIWVPRNCDAKRPE